MPCKFETEDDQKDGDREPEKGLQVPVTVGMFLVGRFLSGFDPGPDQH